MKKLFLFLSILCFMLVACESDNTDNTDYTITISPKELTFSNEEGEKTISITANFEYEVADDVSWITTEKIYNGVLVMVKRNDGHSERTAEILVYNDNYDVKENIKIVQKAGPYKLGDLVTINGCNGVVFQTGTITKIVSVNETKAIWSGVEEKTGATNSDDGVGNMAAIKKMASWEYYYPAFKWCSDYGPDWYLPAYRELYDIYEKIETINSTLYANGYTAIKNGVYYWSSTGSTSSNIHGTETYYDMAYARLMSSNDYSTRHGRSNEFRVRAVLAIKNND